MADKTSYLVEVYDTSWSPYTDDPEDNWTVVNQETYKTFAEAEEAALSSRGIWRSVRIRKLESTQVAFYQDGVAVE